MRKLWIVIRTTWLHVVRGWRVCDSCKQFVPKPKPFLKAQLCEPCHKSVVEIVGPALKEITRQKKIVAGQFDV
jgi:cytochrome c551/c552